MGEMVAYAMAWKKGQGWPTPPSPPTLAYMVNAALLWKKGEAYHHDPAVEPPFVTGGATTGEIVVTVE